MNSYRILHIFIFCFIVILSVNGQSVLDRRIDFAVSAKSIPEALFLLSEKADVNIVFSPNFFEKSEKINLQFQNQTVRTVLTAILKNTDYEFKEQKGSLLLSKKILVEYYDLCGYVRDSESGETLPNAVIFEPKTGNGVLTNGYGYYCIKLKKGETTLLFSYVGYTKQEQQVTIKNGSKLDMVLKPSITLKEVVLVSSLVEKMVQEAPNQQNILTKKLSTYPSVGGEPDLLRQVQALPGVQTGADGLGGLHVRGGNADQNLILLDDVPVFNPSHTSGLFSIFNTSLVKSAVLTKGGFPARYGGRLSSVLDVRTKEGSFEKPTATVGIGLIATTLAVETPIVKDKVSILLGGRRSHVDNFLRNRSIKMKEKEGQKGVSDYHFYDANAKINFKLTDKDRFYLSFYTGGDKFTDTTKIITGKLPPQYSDVIYDYNYEWGNRIGSLRWNHIFGKKLFSNTTFIYSRFNYKSNTTKALFAVDTSFFDYASVEVKTGFGSIIEERAIRTDFDYFFNEKHRLKAGLGMTQRSFTPTISSFGNTTKFSKNNVVVNPREPILDLDTVVYSGIENYLYISDEWKTKHWEINAGLHAALFNSKNHHPFSLQPRFSARYFAKPNTALSISGARMTQFLHLLTTTDAGLPNDLWVPSTQKATPENAWLGTLGFHQNLGKNWLFNAEVYYKKMTGLPAYTDTILQKDKKCE